MGPKSRAFQRTSIAFEKKRMLATIQMMQRMTIKESFQIGFLADHMLARRNEDTAGAEHAVHLGTCKLKIAGMMQHGSRKYDIKRAFSKWQAFGEFLYYIDRQRRFRRQRADRAGADDGAGIWLQRSDRKSVARERIAGNAASGANVERPAGAPAQDL